MNLNSSEKLDSEGTMAVLNAISDGTIAASNAISDGIMAASNGTSTQSFEAEQFGKLFVGTGAIKEAQIIGIGLGKLRSSQLDDLHRAEQYAMDQSIKYVMQKQQQARLQHQQKCALYSQALSLMSRIYVGSVNFDVFEDQIREAFLVFGPIKTINMSIDPSTNHHKGFCFIEFELPEAAFIARDTMNGRMFGGRNIKVLPVGRQDTMPQAQPIIDMVMSEARQYNRVYVSSVHPDISEQDLRSVFSAFGDVTKCQLARQPSGRGHRGFGFLEFKTANSVKEAVEGMNGFDLGGQFLQVGRAVAPPDAINYLSGGSGRSDANSALPAAAAIAAAEATARITAQEILGISDKASPGSSPSRHQTPSSPTPPPAAETTQKAIADSSASASPTAPSAVDTTTVTAARSAARRRGFGGFAAGSTVPPPTIVQALSAPPTTTGPTPHTTTTALAAVSAAAPNAVQQNVLPPPGIFQPLPPPSLAPSLVVPKLHQQTSASMAQQKPGIALALPLPASAPAVDTTATVASPTTAITSMAPAEVPEKPVIAPQPPKKAKKEKRDILDRIGDKAHIGTFDASKPATFAPLDPHVAPRDPNAVDSDDEQGDTLAIGGPDSWYALALRDTGTVLKKDTGGTGKGKKQGKERDPNAPKRRRTKKPKLSSGPKLNTAQKIAAANLAGVLSDQLSVQNDKNDEATLASQEHVQIRGNDARHLLIQKLMRTNRSSVVVLRNMVTPEGIDEHLEDEIREECSKYGRVTDVVIVQEQETHSVKIFVRFAEPLQAEEARKAIDGRFFDGRTVAAQSYDQILFDHDDFTG
ncbi:hypothetical protein niasHS_009427 [Heterodera schachtii]|uniref:RRM domain-containing protein n=1 Tax=Heterodera schachtii TaxID=97005 RepID=A0ABD2JBY9_HETSC